MTVKEVTAVGRNKSLTPMAEFLLLFSFLLLPLQAAAASSFDAHSWTNPETGYQMVLEDGAALLSTQETVMLAAEMQEVTAYGNVAFKSLSSNSATAAQFAASYYHSLFGQQSGILFLIDMDNREIYLFSDGAIHKTVTNAYANTITDNSYRHASEGNYYQCASNAFSQVKTLLSGRRIAQPMKYISNALLALILAALANYFIVRLSCGSPKVGEREILEFASTKFHFSNPRIRLIDQTKVYNLPRSSSGGRSHGGGGSGWSGSRGGGGGSRGRSRSGGGRRGGGGGHRF